MSHPPGGVCGTPARRTGSRDLRAGGLGGPAARAPAARPRASGDFSRGGGVVTVTTSVLKGRLMYVAFKTQHHELEVQADLLARGRR
jgi:hypothetical protein